MELTDKSVLEALDTRIRRDLEQASQHVSQVQLLGVLWNILFTFSKDINQE